MEQLKELMQARAVRDRHTNAPAAHKGAAAAPRRASSSRRPPAPEPPPPQTPLPGARADKLEQTKLAERAHKEAAKQERDKAKAAKEEERLAKAAAERLERAYFHPDAKRTHKDERVGMRTRAGAPCAP